MFSDNLLAELNIDMEKDEPVAGKSKTRRRSASPGGVGRSRSGNRAGSFTEDGSSSGDSAINSPEPVSPQKNDRFRDPELDALLEGLGLASLLDGEVTQTTSPEPEVAKDEKQDQEEVPKGEPKKEITSEYESDNPDEPSTSSGPPRRKKIR